jgi:hypothetical protein
LRATTVTAAQPAVDGYLNHLRNASAGGLDESWRQQPGTPVYTKDFDADGVRRGRRYRDLGSTCLCRGREWLDLNGVAKVGQAFD